jgi:stage V sporulation protein G
MFEQLGLTVKRINRWDGEGTTKAFCDVAIAESFLVKGIRVVEGKKGLFVSMPREQGKDGQWYGTFIPLNKEAHQKISEAVLAAYQSGISSDPA